jgi:hypothetical protein
VGHRVSPVRLLGDGISDDAVRLLLTWDKHSCTSIGSVPATQRCQTATGSSAGAAADDVGAGSGRSTGSLGSGDSWATHHSPDTTIAVVAATSAMRGQAGGRVDEAGWVDVNIAYVAGSSRPIDGAVATLLGREGVCRDFAHLTAALLRANNVAARVVSVYAPGLTPMDFHVVTEACIDGSWYVVDPTCLAPREAMVRIATGADASEVAFITTLRGVVELNYMSVSATTDDALPSDDVMRLARLR